MTDGDKACNCEDPELVVTQDRNMAPVYIAGNPYSRFCLNCGRRYFCKDVFWDDADEKYVIPQGEDTPVHVDEYDDENFFECPECGEPHFGFPSGCNVCDQDYHWPDEASD